MSRVLDLQGKRFGSRTVLARAENSPRGSSRWVVQCDCGKLDTVYGRTLTTETAVACRKCRVMKPKTTALVGDVFGTRRVVSYSDKQGYRVVQCECGHTTDVLAHSLEAGHGCFECYTEARRDAAAEKRKLGVPEWYMTRITSNATSRNLVMAVSHEFLQSLWEFQGGKCALSGWNMEWLAERRATASLDRIDSTKGYLPDNVQWVHKDVNKHKMGFSDEEFIEMCRAVAEHADTL